MDHPLVGHPDGQPPEAAQDVGAIAERCLGDPSGRANPLAESRRLFEVRAGVDALPRSCLGCAELQQEVAALNVGRTACEGEGGERPAIVAHGVLVGELLHRTVARRRRVADGVLGMTRLRTRSEVMRQLAEMGLEIRAV